MIFLLEHRTLSRHLDRCDRVIQNESSNPNGCNVCLFSAVMCTSQCKLRANAHYFRSVRVRHNATHVTYPQIRFDLTVRQRVASLTLDCNGVFAIKAYAGFGK